MAAPRPALVPGWLHDHDRSWLALRDEVLHGYVTAAQALRETAHAYLGSESRAVQLLTIPGAAGPGVPVPQLDQPRQPPAPVAEGVGFPQPVDPTALAGSRPTGGDVLDTAIELWRRRRDSASAVVELLRQQLTDLRWHGPAAAAFTSWMHTHLDRCTALADRAEAVHTALTRTDLAVDPPAPSPPLASPSSPVTSPAQPGGSPTAAVTADPTSTAAFASSASPPTGTANSASQPIGADGWPRSETTATSALAAPAPSPSDVRLGAEQIDDEHLDDEHLEFADADPAPDSPTTESHNATLSGDPPTDDELPPHAAGRHEGPSAPMAATLPLAAIANTALFARTDRAHHIVRDIPLPPAASGPVPLPGTTADPPTTSALPVRGHDLPTDPRPRSHPTPRGHTAPPEEPRAHMRQMLPAPDTPSAVWINLARDHDPPAWVDLIAARGLGLNGPGAVDVARTAWRRLRDHHPHAMLIAPEALAHHLLGPNPQLHLADPGVRLVGDPRLGLHTVRDEIERRRATGRHAAPVVLIAPAPTTVSARSELNHALQHRSPPAVVAVLLGHWETGTTLTIAQHHHVSDHHRPPPGLPPLTGARLEPTTPEMLGTPSPTASDRRGTDDHTAAEPADLPTPVEIRTERTPLALSVLGPVRLRYRRPAPGNQPNESDGSSSEEVLAVPGISRPARELLAYLAAHPGGATRDAIIEALWPNSTADRPDTAFHTTISRLRKRLRDVTGTDTTGEVITTSDGRWHLNRAHVTVDYWTFLETHPRNPDPNLRRHDHHIAVHLYQGPFAADVTGEWTHTIREATRRRYLEAINDLTETEITTNPDLALHLLERARNLEPLNEAIYRNIMRIHLNNRRHEAARGIYELLRTHLATIEAKPDPETEQLAAAAHRN